MQFEVTKKLLETIKPVNKDILPQIERHLNSLTKPPGSLGKIETIATRLGLIQRTIKPELDFPAVVVMAADHGIASAGTSAYPQEVTRQMVLNFLSGGAAINVFSRISNAKVFVVDMGIKGEPIDNPELIKMSIDKGTKNFAVEPAMKESSVMKAVSNGMEFAQSLIQQGVDIFIPGDMGIGNTSSATAITSVITHHPVVDVIGSGTGIDSTKLKIKTALIQDAIKKHNPLPLNPIDILCKVGGFEIAGLTGLILGAVSYSKPVLLDGIISTSAALLASLFNKNINDYLFAGHIGKEPAHKHQLEYLGLDPILSLDLRLGEGTGGVLALHILKAACRMMNDMATFSSSGVEC